MSIEMDLEKNALERARWYILVALDAGRPYPVSDDLLLRTLNDASLRLTPLSLRRELSYLRDRKMIEIIGEDGENWEAKLTSLGVDVRTYSVECRAGIARPPKR